MDAFTQFLTDIQDGDEQLDKQAHVVASKLERLDYEQLSAIDHAVQNVDHTKVSHVLPMAAAPQQTSGGHYPHGLTHSEAEIMNKVAAVDFAARQMALKEAGVVGDTAQKGVRAIRRGAGQLAGKAADKVQALRKQLRAQVRKMERQSAPVSKPSAGASAPVSKPSAGASTTKKVDKADKADKGMSGRSKALIGAGVGTVGLGGGAVLYHRAKSSSAAKQIVQNALAKEAGLRDLVRSGSSAVGRGLQRASVDAKVLSKKLPQGKVSRGFGRASVDLKVVGKKLQGQGGPDSKITKGLKNMMNRGR